MRRFRRPSFLVRGLMLDPARLTEKHDFYFDLMPRLAEWGYNTLWWHFCDDEGCALKLESHPELASPFAFTIPEMRKLIRRARECGIEVVPEVECLGHSLFITGLARYAHLFDGNPYGHNAICPSHRDTLPLLGEIVAEVAALFPSRYLHVGLDEAEIGGCPRCARRRKGRPAWGPFAEHVKRVHEIVTRAGKQMIMWADGVENHPALLRTLPRDIVLAHWHYGDVPAEKIRPSVRAGFSVVLVPAVGGQILQPHDKVFDNVNQMVSLAASLSATRCLGVVASWWESNRNLRDTHPVAVAFAGEAIRRATPLDPGAFTRRFVRSHFGLVDRAASDAFHRAHALTLSRSEIKWLFPAHLVHIQNALMLPRERDFARLAAEAETVAATLVAAQRRVRRCHAEFAASTLAARITAAGHRNAVRLKEAHFRLWEATVFAQHKMPRKRVAQSLRQSLASLKETRRVVAPLARAAAREWDRTRHARDDKKDGSSPRQRQRGSRAILAELLRSSRFLGGLCSSYRRAIRVYERGGPLPGGF